MVLHHKLTRKHFSNDLPETDVPSPNRGAVGVRLAWGILVLFDLCLFIASIPAYFSSLESTCTGTMVRCFASFQLTPGNIHALQSIHLSLYEYAVYMLILDIMVSCMFMITGSVICWRLWGRSEERSGLFVSLLLITLGAFGTLSTQEAALEATLLASPLQIILRVAVIFLWVGVGIFLYTFPSGPFIPRWTRFLLILWIVQAILFSLPENAPLAITNWPPLLYLILLLLTFGSAAFTMIYRYMRVFNSTQRQQTKWLIFGFALILPLNPLYAAIGDLSGAFNTPDSPYQLLEPTVLTLIVLVVLLSISFAILRYRLWDIDLLINRTLVYSALTLILTGGYVGLVIGLQALLRGIISQDNSVAIVISTLAIYALFQPLRRHIQRIIDRRFYRSKYDATKTVAAFSATLRQEVDLDQLREHLLAVVQETMQPAHVSLWLRQPERPRQPRDHASSS